jgi:hypothetical protein
MKNVNVRMMMFDFTIEFGFLAMTITVGSKGQSIPSPWNIELNI